MCEMHVQVHVFLSLDVFCFLGKRQTNKFSLAIIAPKKKELLVSARPLSFTS